MVSSPFTSPIRRSPPVIDRVLPGFGKSQVTCPFQSRKDRYTLWKSFRTSPDPKSELPIIFTRVFHACPLGEKPDIEDHDSSVFCVPNQNHRRETFQLARALRKKGGPTIFFSRHR